MSFHHHLPQAPERSHALRGHPVPLKSKVLIPHSLQPLSTQNLLPVSVGVSVLDVSYPWSPTRCVLLGLASLPEHRGFKVQPQGRLYMSFPPFHG